MYARPHNKCPDWRRILHFLDSFNLFLQWSVVRTEIGETYRLFNRTDHRLLILHLREARSLGRRYLGRGAKVYVLALA